MGLGVEMEEGEEEEKEEETEENECFEKGVVVCSREEWGERGGWGE